MKYSKADIRRVVRQLIHYFKVQEELPIQEEKEELLLRIRNDIRQKRLRDMRYRLCAFVASAAVFIGVIYLGIEKYGQYKSTSDLSLIAAKMLEGAEEKNEIQLIISQNEIISIEEDAEVANNQSGVITVNDKKVTDVNTEDNLYAQIIVPKGKHTRLILADGSKLHINAGSKVIYPRCFKKDKREIFVDGEIFVDVKPDKTAPFFVKTSEFEVKVLGTAFNVNAYKADGRAEVTLVRGSVQLKDSKDQIMILAPNQQGELKAGLLSGKKSVNAEDYMAWTQGLLVLHGESLSGVFEKLKRYYGEQIAFDTTIQGLTIRGSLDLEYPIEEVLNRIAITAPIKYVKTKDGYFVTKKSE